MDSEPDNPFRPPSAQYPYPNADQPDFSRIGGLKRLPFVALTILMFSIIGICSNIIDNRIDGSNASSDAVVSLIGLLATIFGLVLTSYRLKNLGYSPWRCFGAFVPIYNLLIAYRCLAGPAGYRFTKQLDGYGVVVAFMFWGALLLGLAIIVLTAFILVQFGAQ